MFTYLRASILSFLVAAGIGFGRIAFGWQMPSGWVDYNTRIWQMEDGLPHNIVQAITQTRDGYLWVGTREGLARFDGIRFQPIQLSPEKPLLSITALMQSSDGTMWIGTDSSGLFRLRGQQVERCSSPDGALDFAVQDIQEGGAGEIWITSANRIFRWANGRLEPRAEFRSALQTLCVRSDGSVWTAGGGVLKRLDAEDTNRVSSSSFPQPARRLHCDQRGTFWVGAANGLVQITNGVARYVKKADGPSGFISVILSDRAGTLWVGTYSGLSRFVDGRFRDEGESDALAYRVYAMYEDREQNLWVGSEEGLARLTPKVFQTLTKKDGLTLNTVATVCAAPDGGVWISAWGGGLNHWVEGKFSFINKSNGLSSNFIMAMCAGRDGSLWAGADYGAALNWIKDGKIEIFDKDRGFITSPRTATTALYESPQGVLWVGSREMLQRWDGTNFHAFTTADGLSHAKINAICGGFGETVWIGTDGGLTRLQEGKFENLGLADPRLRTSILSLYEDEDRVLWIGTQRQGLLRLQADVVNEFTSRQGLLSDAIYSILEDANTNLWLNSSRGIFRVDKGQVADVLRGRRESIHSVTYSRVDGVLSSGQYRDVTQPSACKDADGRLWFRTTQGVAVVNPDQIKHNNQIPPVLIQSVMADKQPVGVTPLDLEIPPEIRIPPGRGELEIQYTALSLRAPEKNQFQYKLEGADLNWVDSGTRRVAFYNNLKPGRYRFQVVGCNNDGTWNEVGTSVFLILAPHFWQTRWFMAGVILASAAAVGGAARYVTRRRMQRKLVLLEQERAVEQERARIARDMHDELGAKLTRISFQGAMARQSASIPPETEKHIAKMAETARELVLSLDQIVWAVDPENDSLESLANYICRHASDFFENSPIQCKFSIPRELPACHLSTEVRHHIFLAVKEALNNALKHSGAKRVVLSISTSAGKLEISIADDGCGIADAKEPDKARRAGHGLINLRKRLASIHGQFELKNGPGRGTEVRFVVPLAEGTHTFI